MGGTPAPMGATPQGAPAHQTVCLWFCPPRSRVADSLPPPGRRRPTTEAAQQPACCRGQWWRQRQEGPGTWNILINCWLFIFVFVFVCARACVRGVPAGRVYQRLLRPCLQAVKNCEGPVPVYKPVGTSNFLHSLFHPLEQVKRTRPAVSFLRC